MNSHFLKKLYLSYYLSRYPITSHGMEFAYVDKYRLWKSRETILEILADRGYSDTNIHTSLTIDEFVNWIGEDGECVAMDAMTIIVEKQTKKGKIIKTMVSWIPKLGVPQLGALTHRMKMEDCQNMIAVTHKEIKHQAHAFIASMTKMNIYIQVYTISELQFNISKHRLVPKHTLATKKEVKTLLEAYGVKKFDLHKILSTDPMVRHLGARKGDVLRIERDSETQPGYKDITYRCVV